MTAIKIAIFASGEGTNAQRLIDHFRTGNKAEVVLVVSNKADAPVLLRAQKAGIATLVLDRNSFFETELVSNFLLQRNIDLVVLAGFLWKIPGHLLRTFPNRIINIHPALLPKFGGKGMYGKYVHEAVLAAGEKESGISIHLVNENYDEGKILAQYHCPVEPSDTAESLAKKIHELEHRHFPPVIENYLTLLQPTH